MSQDEMRVEKNWTKLFCFKVPEWSILGIYNVLGKAKECTVLPLESCYTFSSLETKISRI